MQRIDKPPYLLPFREYQMVDVAWQPNVLSDAFMDMLTCDVEENVSMTQGHAGATVNQSIRNAKNFMLYPEDTRSFNAHEVFSALAHYAATLNARYFRVNKEHLGLYEGIQYSRYREGEHYQASHVDRVHAATRILVPRKLSVSVQLSDPATYDGGDLIIDGSSETHAPRGRCGWHGGTGNTGPKTAEGKKRIGDAQRLRWVQYRIAKRSAEDGCVENEG